MSSYACPGCGLDAPLTQECPRCEGEHLGEGSVMQTIGRLLQRLQSTRAALIRERENYRAAGAIIVKVREEANAQRERAAALATAVQVADQDRMRIGAEMRERAETAERRLKELGHG